MPADSSPTGDGQAFGIAVWNKSKPEDENGGFKVVGLNGCIVGLAEKGRHAEFES